MHIVLRPLADLMPGFVQNFMAQAMTDQGIGSNGFGSFLFLTVFVLFLILSAVLTKVWIGIVNVSLIDTESLSSIENRHPYLPSLKVIIWALVGTVLLVVISLPTMQAIAPFRGPMGMERATFVTGALGAIMVVSLLIWRKAKEYVFATAIGTVMSDFVVASFFPVIRTIVRRVFCH